MVDPRGKTIFSPIYEKLEAEARKMFGGSDGKERRYATDGAMGMDIMEMFNNMPVVSVLTFQRRVWSEHPEDIVADLLTRVHRQET